MKLSVIVPTFNRDSLLSKTLSSIRQQTLPKDRFEVVVVDDGSQDSTINVIRSFQSSLDLDYVFHEDKGYRLAAARNLGIAASCNKICVFIDCGILLHSEALDQHAKCHAETEMPTAINGYTFGFEQGDENAAELNRLVCLDDIDGSIAQLAKSGQYNDIRDSIYAAVEDEMMRLPAPWALFWGCHTSVPRDYLLKIGMYDITFQSWGGEDDDLAYRLQRLGVRFRLCRDAMGIHYPHEKHEEANYRSGIRNLEYMHKKYGDEIIRRRIVLGWDGVNSRSLDVTP